MKIEKIGKLWIDATLLWVVVAMLAGCAAGTAASKPVAAQDRGIQEPAAVAATVERPDYATKLAEFVAARQPQDIARDRWGEFTEAAAGISGAWEFFVAGNPQLATGPAEPDHAVAQDPSRIDRPEHGALLPDVRVFLAGLERTNLLSKLDKVAEPSRFVALRAVDPLVSTAMPELGRARLCARICVARMHIAALDGKPDEVVRSLNHALGLARGAEGRGMLLGTLLAHAIWSSAERQLRQEIIAGRLPPGACAQALAMLENAPMPSVRAALAGERFQALETIELYFEQHAEEHAAATVAPISAAPPQSNPPHASREEQLELAGRLFDGIDGLFAPDAAARDRARADIARVERLWSTDAGRVRYEPVRTVKPAVASSMQTEQRTRVLHDGTRLMLALEVYRARTGNYPESLAELVPRELGAIPQDVLSPDSPRAFVYRRTEPSAVGAARSYILYSVGMDGLDNGGTPRTKGGALIFNAPE